MAQPSRYAPLAAVVLLAFRLFACSSNHAGASQGGTGATGTGAAGTGAASTGGHGTGGTGGQPTPCDIYGNCPSSPASCTGNTLVWQAQACDLATNTCQGPAKNLSEVCAGGSVCTAGQCLARAAAPVEPCTVATDCGLPASVCAGAAAQMTFSDPACDDGQCHYKQILVDCAKSGSGEDTAGFCNVASGNCDFIAPMETAVFPPQPGPYATQPSPPPAQACAAVTDCQAPPVTCFQDSVLTYANPACVTGSCVWELALAQCVHGCAAGACASP
jgi:hypothetical protein